MLPTKDELESALEYEPGTGALRWRQRDDRSDYWNRRYAGTEAGTISKSHGYRVIKLDGRFVLAHRVVWFIHYGEWPPLLDHRDRNRLNNRVGNLRVATRKQNAANAIGWGRLPKGVQVSGGRFSARIGIDYKQVYLGTFDTAEEAHAAYMDKAKELWGEFSPEGGI